MLLKVSSYNYPVVSSNCCTAPGMPMLAGKVQFKFTLVLPRAALKEKLHEVHF